MQPIIKASTVLIPMRIGEKSGVSEDLEELQFDVWSLIDKIRLLDCPLYTINPSMLWSYGEWSEVRYHTVDKYETLLDVLSQNEFWEAHNIIEGNQAKLIWCIIGSGLTMYNAVLSDYTFATAFIDQDRGFMTFMKRYT